MVPSFPIYNIKSNDGYHDRIITLFCLLDEANRADSEDAAPWQRFDDASQRSGYFGHLYRAIKEIAGPHIFEHWCKCHELDLTLATRNPGRKRRYRVRFNLEAGPHKGWWLIQDTIDPEEQNQPQWVNPASRSLYMHDCKLIIDNATAARICKGTSSKRACAWIECEEIEVIRPGAALDTQEFCFSEGVSMISFNPRVTPHWMYQAEVADNMVLPTILTHGKIVYTNI